MLKIIKRKVKNASIIKKIVVDRLGCRSVGVLLVSISNSVDSVFSAEKLKPS